HHADYRAAGRHVVHRGGRRVREVHAAFEVRDDVVRTAEGLPLVVVRDDSLLPFRPYDARSKETGPRLDRNELALRVEGHAERVEQPTYEGDRLIVLVQPHNAVGLRLGEDQADIREPEGIVRTRQSLEHHLGHRAAGDDAGDIGSRLQLNGVGWSLSN